MVGSTGSGEWRLEEARRLRDRGLELSGAGRYGEADPLFRRAMSLRESVFGRMHPEVAQLQVDLGVLEEAQGGDGRAETCYRRALSMLQLPHGGVDPAAADVHARLARLFERLGRVIEARQQLRCALAIDEQALGPDHPALVSRLEALARRLGESDLEAELLLLRASELRKQTSPNPPREAALPRR